MRAKNILIVFIIVVAVVAGVLLIKNRAKVTPSTFPSSSPSIQQKLQNKFNGLVVPKDQESVELKDVSGGNAIGLATRSEILADLPVPQKGETYQGLLENSSGKTILLGNLKMAKGGWILNYNSSLYPGYNKVVVVVGQERILEGSF